MGNHFLQVTYYINQLQVKVDVTYERGIQRPRNHFSLFLVTFDI